MFSMTHSTASRQPLLLTASQRCCVHKLQKNASLAPLPQNSAKMQSRLDSETPVPVSCLPWGLCSSRPVARCPCWDRSMLNLEGVICNLETPKLGLSCVDALCDPGDTQENETASTKKGHKTHHLNRERQRQESCFRAQLQGDFADDRHRLRRVHSRLQPLVVQNSQKQLVMVRQESEFLVVVEDGRTRIQAVIE